MKVLPFIKDIAFFKMNGKSNTYPRKQSPADTGFCFFCLNVRSATTPHTFPVL